MTVAVRDSGLWECHYRVATFLGDITSGPDAELVDELEFGNTLMYGGVSSLWQWALGNGTTTAGQTLTYLNSANAAIGAGDSSTPAIATQQNLQAPTNKLRVGMDSTFPQHTDGATSLSNTITLRSTYSTGQANFNWQEVACFTSTVDAVGRMLNRAAQSIGLKDSTVSRVVTASITIV